MSKDFRVLIDDLQNDGHYSRIYNMSINLRILILKGNRNIADCCNYVNNVVKSENLKNLTDLTASKLSNSLLDENFINSLEDSFIDKSSRDGKKIVDNLIANQGLKIRSPYTGLEIISNIVVLDNVFYFNDPNGAFLVLFSSPWRSGFSHFHFYLINEKLLLSSDNDLSSIGQAYRDLARLLKLYLLNKNTFDNLIENNKQKQLLLTNYNYQHLGHNLWNGLSGWGFVFDDPQHYDNCKKVVQSNVFVLNENIIDFNYDCSTEVEFEEFEHTNNLVFFLKSKYITEKVAKLVKPNESRGSILNTNIRNKYGFSMDSNSYYVLISIRTGNRSLINAFEVYKNIITRLIKEYGVSIVLDGMNSSSVSVKSSHKNIDINDDYKLAGELVSLFPENVFSLVGSSIEENLYVISHSEFCISPWGAGLAKIKWICNKPSIIFSSNIAMVSKSDFSIYSSIQFRENACPDIILDSRFVVDEMKIDRHFKGDFYFLEGVTDEIMRLSKKLLGKK